ncbi:MAG: cytochrome C [Pseudonocardiales bacterium]|nr:MAG: cytochrome C [Pseudonocardiales bacterium]
MSTDRLRNPRLRGRFRRFSGLIVIGLALGLISGIYALATPGRGGTPAAAAPDDVTQGQRLYNQSCISCHGRNLQGVPSQGPTLIGVGGAAVDFQVTTGRMPAPYQGAQVPRRKPLFDDEQARQLAAYVQSIGGGPDIPTGSLADGDLARGGRLFRLNCASCHNFVGEGGPLSSGKYAPALSKATPTQTYEAMLSGPESMPVFGDNQLTPQEKLDIISYVESLKKERDPGGFAIGRVGPVPEGLVIWLVGIGLVLIATLWIGVKA